MSNTKYISKITVDSTEYSVKDAEAREMLEKMNVALSSEDISVGTVLTYSDDGLTATETDTGVTLEATFSFN